MQLEDNLRQNLLGQLSDEKSEIDVTVASKIVREFAVSFYLFLAENYYTEKETWSNSNLIPQEVQDRKTYEIMRIEKALEIFEKQLI